MSQRQRPRSSQASRGPAGRGNSDSQLNENETVAFHPLPIAGILASLYATVAGFLAVFLVVFIVWLLAAHGDESTVEVFRASGIAWLATHLIPIVIGGNPFGLLPWAFALVPALAIRKSLCWAMKSARPKELYEFWLLAGFVTIGYSTLALFVSMFAGTPDLFTSDLNALTHSLLLAALVTGLCVWQDSQAHSLLLTWVPPVIKAGVRPGLIAGMVLFFVGSLACTISLTLQFQQVRAVTGLIAPNNLDAFFLTVLELGYLPTMIIWCVAYLIGPGILVGSDTAISVLSAYQGRLPAVPLLAILPTQPQRLASYFVLVPILAGLAIYLATVRQRWIPPSKSFMVSAFSAVRAYELLTLVTSVLTLGLLVYLASAVSSGPLGLKLLDFVGPNAGLVARQAMLLAGTTALTLIVVPRVLLSALWAVKHRQSSRS